MHNFHESLIWASPDLFTYRGAFHYNSRIYSKVGGKRSYLHTNANIIIYERTCRKIVLISCYSQLNIKCVSHNSVLVPFAERPSSLLGVFLCVGACACTNSHVHVHISVYLMNPSRVVNES